MLSFRFALATALAIAMFLAPPVAFCQPVADTEVADQSAAPVLTADAYVPITGIGRVRWIVEGTVGKQSLLLVGPLSASWNTAWNTPEEWRRSVSGFVKRYAEREADVAISNTIEAGLGAIWGEEPRYVPSGRRGIWPRARYAIKTVFVVQRRDGRLHPAWGRYAGNVFNNMVENTWLPPSVTTPAQTALRSGLGFASRMGGNVFEEFWPDVARLLRRK